MIKTIRAVKSNCKSLFIAEENFVVKEQSVRIIADNALIRLYYFSFFENYMATVHEKIQMAFPMKLLIQFFMKFHVKHLYVSYTRFSKNRS